MLFLRKRLCRATSAKLATLPYRKPTSDYSGFSLTEQCDPAQENLLSEHYVPSGEMNPSDIAMGKKVVVVRLWWKTLL